jgi:outer membrane protein OmpA-like peptidoglycan-associated protein
LQAKGYGKANPIAPNGDEAGKAANRRVELIKL